MTEQSFTRGEEIRRAVLGQSYVDRKNEQTHEFDHDFQHFLTEATWGSVWSREGLDLRTRSLITLAILAVLRHDEDFTVHLRAIKNTGATAEEVREMLMHVAVYAGMPTAHHASKLSKRILAEFMEGAA